MAHGWTTPSIVARRRSPSWETGIWLAAAPAVVPVDGAADPRELDSADGVLAGWAAPVDADLVDPSAPHAETTRTRIASLAIRAHRGLRTRDHIYGHTRLATGLVARTTDREVDRSNNVDNYGDTLTSALRRDDGESLHHQVERRIRAAITDGRLRPGVRLMSTRVLARELGIARITVQTAYDQLNAEGYLAVDGRRGTHVATDLPDGWFDPRGPAVPIQSERFPEVNPWAASSSVTSPTVSKVSLIDLGPEWFEMANLDARGWERRLVRAWRELATEPDSAAATYAAPLGDTRLRAALADHLTVRRGVRCHADAIALTAGATAAFAAIARTWLGPDRVCVVEDPSGEQIRRSLGASGARILPVPVDDHGIRLDRLPPRADVLFVTPSWQYPAGGSLSLPRRLGLVRWATNAGAVIVEDDCESELRYDGRPLPSLQGLAPDGRVVYVSTFSKVLFPGLRTGYMVVPEAHRGPLLAALEAGGRPPAAVEQRALAMLLEDGGFLRHVRRLRAIYAARRDRFSRALAAEGIALEVRRASAGGHLIVGILDARWSASELASALAESGIRVEPLAANRLLDAADDEFVVYLARLDVDAIASVAASLGRLLRARPVSTTGPSSFP